MSQSITEKFESLLAAEPGEVEQSLQGKLATTPEFRRRLKELSQLSTGRGLSAVAVDWAVIAACFATAIAVPYAAVWIVCAIVIASRQHALLIIMHDASHHRVLPSRKWNDRLSNWLLAWPLLVSTEGYRDNHLPHHFYLNTDDDPDWVRKEGRPEWEFPKTRWQLIKLLARDFFGGGFYDMLRAIGDLSNRMEIPGEEPPRGWSKIVYYALLAAGVIASGLWFPVLTLWYLPAFTLLPVILRIRSIAEHFGVEGEHELNMSRNFGGRWWEILLLAPHNVGYHLDHHLFPSVPFYRLPELHEALAQLPDYAAHSHQNDTLLGLKGTSVLNDVAA